MSVVTQYDLFSSYETFKRVLYTVWCWTTNMTNRGSWSGLVWLPPQTDVELIECDGETDDMCRFVCCLLLLTIVKVVSPIPAPLLMTRV